MLNELRQQINHIDSQLLSLLNERLQMVEKIAQYKTKNALPILDPQREMAVIHKLQQQAQKADYLLSAADIAQIYQHIFALSRQWQQAKIAEKET